MSITGKMTIGKRLVTATGRADVSQKIVMSKTPYPALASYLQNFIFFKKFDLMKLITINNNYRSVNE